MMERLKHLVVNMLSWEARMVLQKQKPIIVAIAGSVGKTSTKDAVARVLATKFLVRKSEKSLNSEIGVPLAILGLESAWKNPFGWIMNILRGLKEIYRKDFPQMLVLEVGADHPGDIRSIMKWLRPDVAVLTSFPDTPVHVEFFQSREALWDEDAEVMRALQDDGLIVANGDDPNILRYLAPIEKKKVTYGMRENATTFHGGFVEPLMEGDRPTGMAFKVELKSNAFPVKVWGILGAQLCTSLLAGIATGVSLGVPPLDAISALAKLDFPKGRMRILGGGNGSTIIDDTYNSSPIAAEAALHAIEHVPTKGRRIAVLGDMRELGGYSVTEHRKLGLLAGNICDVVIGVGMSAKDLVESAKGKKAQKIEWCVTAEEAGEKVKAILKGGDIVLVKGSQGMRMEKCSAILLANSEDAKHLPRQERAWRRR